MFAVKLLLRCGASKFQDLIYFTLSLFVGYNITRITRASYTSTFFFHYSMSLLTIPRGCDNCLWVEEVITDLEARISTLHQITVHCLRDYRGSSWVCSHHPRSRDCAMSHFCHCHLCCTISCSVLPPAQPDDAWVRLGEKSKVPVLVLALQRQIWKASFHLVPLLLSRLVPSSCQTDSTPLTCLSFPPWLGALNHLRYQT